MRLAVEAKDVVSLSAMPRLISYYIFKEMAAPFLLSVAVLTITMLLGRVLTILELYLTHGLDARFVFGFLVSALPPILIFIVPASFLVGIIIALARLSSDSEIIALKAGGVSLYHIARPVALFAIITYAITLALTLYGYPWGNHNLRSLLIEAASKGAASAIEEKVFYDNFKDVVMYVDHIPVKGKEKDRLKGVFIYEITDEGTTNIIYAEGGVFVPTSEPFNVTLRLSDGALHKKDVEQKTYHIINFSTYNIELWAKGAGVKQSERWKKDRELYVSELRERIKDFKDSGKPTESLIVDLHKRFSIPAAVFVFALIGVPLGIQRVRSPRFTGFGLALTVIVAYYILSKIFESLGTNGRLDPALAAWSTNALLLALGLYVFILSAREKQIRLVAALEDITQSLGEKIGGAVGFLERSRHRKDGSRK